MHDETLSPSESSTYLIDKILPANEVHLLGGPSGAGKTTLILQLLESWSRGEDLWGYRSHPAPFCYVSCDRGVRALARTRDRMNLQIELPSLSILRMHKDHRDFMHVSEAARRKVPDCKLIIMDAIGVLSPNGKISDYALVSEFLMSLSAYCEDQELTVIGLGHSTKTKEGEGISNPRQRFLGSVAWGGFTETMIFIEPVHADKPENPCRRVQLLPRNAPSETMYYSFGPDGRLTSTAAAISNLTLDMHLAQHPEQLPLTRALILEWADEAKIPMRTAEYWITQQMENGLLERIARGTYKRRIPS